MASAANHIPKKAERLSLLDRGAGHLFLSKRYLREESWSSKESDDNLRIMLPDFDPARLCVVHFDLALQDDMCEVALTPDGGMDDDVFLGLKLTKRGRRLAVQANTRIDSTWQEICSYTFDTPSPGSTSFVLRIHILPDGYKLFFNNSVITESPVRKTPPRPSFDKDQKLFFVVRKSSDYGNPYNVVVHGVTWGTAACQVPPVPLTVRETTTSRVSGREDVTVDSCRVRLADISRAGLSDLTSLYTFACGVVGDKNVTDVDGGDDTHPLAAIVEFTDVRHARTFADYYSKFISAASCRR